jgi:pSer/pThr/pTyr-binding forkhead associated (FHA) protein
MRLMAKSYSIGRRQTCDIVLSDPSVSRDHAALQVDGHSNVTLIDRDSRFGTFVRRNAGHEWEKIRSTRLDRDHGVRFGRYETTAREIMAQLPLDVARPMPRAGVSQDTPLERNPDTGEIIPRRR